MFFLNAEKGQNQWWLFLFGTLVVALGYLTGQIPLSLVLGLKVSRDPSLSQEDLETFTQDLDFGRFGISTNTGLFLSLLIFVFALLFLYLAIKLLHKRSFLSLISWQQKIDWQRLFWGFGVWFLLSLILEALSYFIDPGNYVFHPPKIDFVYLLLICLFILPVQTSFEELFFRGYLLQASGKFLRSKWLALLITTLLFMAVHLANPEIDKYGLWNMIPYYFTAGIVLGFITIMDDRLELVLGIHFATNFFGASLVSYEGAALQTGSLYTVHQIEPLIMTIAFTGLSAIFCYLASKKYKWKSISGSFRLQLSVNTTNNNTVN